MNPFKSDPQAALDRARSKLAGVESNITALQEQRAAKLVTAEDASEVLAIDKSIAAERANAEIYRDKIRALQEECRIPVSRRPSQESHRENFSPIEEARGAGIQAAGGAYDSWPTVFRAYGLGW
jgi:hypothetical protein